MYHKRNSTGDKAMSIAKALLELTPGAKWVIRDDVIDWMDTEQTQPTQEDIVQKIAELEYIEEVKEYQRLRKAEYGALNQFEMQYDDQMNGTTTWVDSIQAIKDKYPKVEVDDTELASRQAQALHDYQLEEYTKAQARLAQYQVALGREEQTEEFVIGQEWNEEGEEMVDVTETRVTAYALDPVEATIEHTTYDEEGNAVTVTVDNPLITADNEERAAAQAIVDATPQEVIDAYNAL